MKKSYPDWEVYKKDKCSCVYCDFSGLNNFHAWRQLAIDHLIPVARGGSDDHANKAVSCTRCNVLKGSYDPSNGSKPEKITSEIRKELIARVKKYLDIENSEERRDFEEMMSEF